MLSEQHPRVIRYRSAEPVLRPELPQEQTGAFANVVFPTGIDRRGDLGTPDRFNVYYLDGPQPDWRGAPRRAGSATA